MRTDLENAIMECENRIGDSINELRRISKPAQISEVNVKIKKLEYQKGKYKYSIEDINVILTKPKITDVKRK